MTNPIQTLAAELAATFKESTRVDGSVFRLTDSERSKSCVKAVHMSMPGQPLPDDWLYEATERALSTVADADLDVPDARYELATQFADSNTDTEYYKLRQWFATCSIASDMIDEAVEELGSEKSGIWRMLEVGQYYTLERVFNTVYEWLESQVTEHAEATQ